MDEEKKITGGSQNETGMTTGSSEAADTEIAIEHLANETAKEEDKAGRSDTSSGTGDSRKEDAVQKNVPQSARPEKPKRKKKRKWKRWVALAVVAAILVGLFLRFRQNSQQNTAFVQAQASKRDIQTYLSFTGTVEAVNSQDLTSTVSGVKVLKVNYEKGDTVKKGDVIATLDTSSVDDQIAQSEATLNKTKAQGQEQIEQAQTNYNNLKTTTANGTNSTISSAENQLESAQKNYDDLKNNIDSGMETSIMNAQNSMTQAFQNLTSAQQAYNDEVSLNNQQLSQTIMSAQQQVESAYQQVLSAQQSLSQAQATRDRNSEKSSSKFGGTTSKEDTLFSNDQQIASAEQQLESAESSYKSAKTSYEAAKQNEESSLTKLYDSLLSAQTSYLAAVDSYNATVNSVNQQLEGYAQQVEQAEDSLEAAKVSNSQQLESYAQQVEQAVTSADSTTSELQLQQLKDSLDDYEIVAPIDGELTALDLKEGETLSATSTIGTVTDFSTMKIDINISEYDIQGVSKGTPVTITLDAISGKSYDGEISYISHEATVSSGVSYFEAEVEFTADDDARSGMSAEIKVTVNDLKDVLTVPNDAIQTATDGTSYVLTAGDDANGTMTQTTIETGATDGSYTEVTSGLSEGDTVYYAAATGSSDLSQMMMGGGMGGGDMGGGPGGGGGNPPSGGGPQ